MEGARHSPHLQQPSFQAYDNAAAAAAQPSQPSILFNEGHSSDSAETTIRPVPSPQHRQSDDGRPYVASPDSTFQTPPNMYSPYPPPPTDISTTAVISSPHTSAPISTSNSPAPPSTSSTPAPAAPVPVLAPVPRPHPPASTSTHSSLPATALASRQQSTSSVTSDGSLGLGPGTGNGPSTGIPNPSTSTSIQEIPSSINGQTAQIEVVPVAFDEGVLRALCDLDCALPLITERIKQGISSCKQVATFFRSRAELEEKYARSLVELTRISGESYSRTYCKAGTFVEAYHATLRVHETVAQNRTRFAQRLTEMSDELLSLAREGERLRKLHKENGMRYERNLQESEMLMEKAKSRFDTTAEELERILVAKEGESMKDSGMHGPGSGMGNSSSSVANSKEKRSLGKAMKGGILFKGKGPAQMQRQEDEVRGRMSMASEVFRKAVLESQSVRQEYFGLHLPKILRLLKECADEIDLGTQYHLARYAYLYESTILGDGAAIAPMGPEDGRGLKSIVESIDSRTDFKNFMQNFAVARGSVRGPRREGPYEDGFAPALPPHVLASQQAQAQNSIPPSSLGHGEANATQSMPGAYAPPVPSHATFGVELGEQMVRDGTEIPKVVEKCAQAIETFGLESKGIYRLSGTTSKVQKLKAALDKDVDAVDVTSDEWTSDINVVASALKQWFRELPEPLLTHGLYQGFIDAARYDNDRLRHIRLHEQVNELPDPNYATLKFFMGHLDKIRRSEHINQMSISNLSIVFGPTLLGAPPSMGALNLEHMSFQCKAIETILERYKEIFVEEEEAA